MPSHAVYLYVHTTVPLHVIGSGVDVDPIKTGAIVFPHASVIFPGEPGSTAADGHVTFSAPLAGGVKLPLRVTLYVYVQSAVVPSHAVYLYVHTTVPLHVIGDGVDVDPIKTGVIIFPQASVIFPGEPGSTAADGQVTFSAPFAGGVKAPL